MTNFDFLKKIPEFQVFADAAVSAELMLHIDVDACVISCRRAMEFAIKWMFSIDNDLKMPHNDSLVCLLEDEDFATIVGKDMLRRLEYIRKIGNKAAHGEDKVVKQQAELCLENLFEFLDFVAYCYHRNYREREFDRKLLELTLEEVLDFVTEDVDLQTLREQNESDREEFTARRNQHCSTYVARPYSDEF